MNDVETKPNPTKPVLTRQHLGQRKTFIAGKRLEELIDPETKYYRAGSGYDDTRLAEEFGVGLWAIKNLRTRLFGARADMQGSRRIVGNRNREQARAAEREELLAEIAMLKSRLDEIDALKNRIESLETTLFGEAA